MKGRVGYHMCFAANDCVQFKKGRTTPGQFIQVNCYLSVLSGQNQKARRTIIIILYCGNTGKLIHILTPSELTLYRQREEKKVPA